MDSNSSAKFWTVDEVEREIKAQLLLNEVAVGAADLGQARLSSGNLRERIARPRAKPPGWKIFSEAIDALEERREISGKDEGRRRYYSLTQPGKELQREVLAAAQSSFIEHAAQVGVYQSALQGWVYFGVAPEMSQRLQRPLREAAEEFQERLDGILKGEVERFLSRLRKRLRGRLPPREIGRGIQGLREVFEATTAFRLHLGATAVGEAFLERVAPAALQPLVEQSAKIASQSPAPAAKLIALATGYPEGRVRRELARDEKRKKATRRIFSVLPKAEAKKVGDEFRRLVSLHAALCAVIR